MLKINKNKNKQNTCLNLFNNTKFMIEDKNKDSDSVKVNSNGKGLKLRLNLKLKGSIGDSGVKNESSLSREDILKRLKNQERKGKHL